MTLDPLRIRLRKGRRQERLGGDVPYHEHQAEDLTGGIFSGIVLGGDLRSTNWGSGGGAIPADLSSVDAGATAGYYWDHSVGSAQIMGDLFIGGTLTLISGGTGTFTGNITVAGTSEFTGNVTLESDLIMSTGGAIKTASSGPRFELSKTDSNRLSMFTDDGDELGAGQLVSSDVASQPRVDLQTSFYQDSGGKTGISELILIGGKADESDDGSFDLRTDIARDTWSQIVATADGTDANIEIKALGGSTPFIGFHTGGSARAYVRNDGFRIVPDGSAAAPSLHWHSDPTTGLYRVAPNQTIYFATNGVFRMLLGLGLMVGGATGGDKGLGTINISADIYKNNTAYTNPDWVLELAATGTVTKYADRLPDDPILHLIPLDELRHHVRDHHRLPGITDDPAGMFERGDIALEWIERLVLYTLELESCLASVEAA